MSFSADLPTIINVTSKVSNPGAVDGGSSPGSSTGTSTDGKKQMSNTANIQQPSYTVTFLAIGLVALLYAVPLVLVYRESVFWRNSILHTSQMTFDENLDSLNSNSSDGSQHSIWRRQTQQQDTTTVPPFTNPGTNDGPTSTMIHVAGNNQTNYTANAWITWMDIEEGLTSLSTKHMPFKQNKFIIIPRSGYYYVYTQLTYKDITYRDTSRYQTGHDVVRQANCGNGGSDDQILMRSYITQQSDLKTLTDSAYVGGVFYLSHNDRIGVRTMRDGATKYSFLSSLNERQPKSLCFFGAYMLASDPAADASTEDDCCCQRSECC